MCLWNCYLILLLKTFHFIPLYCFFASFSFMTETTERWWRLIKTLPPMCVSTLSSSQQRLLVFMALTDLYSDRRSASQAWPPFPPPLFRFLFYEASFSTSTLSLPINYYICINKWHSPKDCKILSKTKDKVKYLDECSHFWIHDSGMWMRTNTHLTDRYLMSLVCQEFITIHRNINLSKHLV